VQKTYTSVRDRETKNISITEYRGCDVYTGKYATQYQNAYCILVTLAKLNTTSHKTMCGVLHTQEREEK